MKKNSKLIPKGYLLLSVLVFGSVAIIVLGGLVSLSIYESRIATTRQNLELAFQIAESGIEYYRWHLAHDQTDYQDGTGAPGPYVHDFKDKNNVVIGQFSLNIIPPPVGSTLVVVESTGYLLSAPTQRKTIRARFAIASFAKYAIVTNDNIQYGDTTTTYGELHSNGGTRFDGVAHNLVSSQKTTYSYGGVTKPGVWTSHSPESAVFLAGKQVSVPKVDFTGIIAALGTIQDKADHYYGPSDKYGYHIVLHTNDTYDLTIVKKLKTKCTNKVNESTWAINTGQEQIVAGSPFPFPADGLIFIDDNVWVDGALDTARLTIAAAHFSDPTRSIIINGNITYTHNDGSEVLGLIAEKDIIYGIEASGGGLLTVDGALVAANGSVHRPHVPDNSCSPYRYPTELNTYGMIGSYMSPYVYSCDWYGCSGYLSRTYNYDANLLYSPPPEFPLASDSYEVLDWQEINP